MTIARRDLLKAGGAVIVSFAFRPTVRSAEAFALHSDADVIASQGSDGKPLDPASVDSFLAFHRDGTVTVYTGGKRLQKDVEVTGGTTSIDVE